jgi:hypothetical protein
MNREQLNEMRRILGTDTEMPGKVIGIRDGGALVATPIGAIQTRTFAEIGSRVVLKDGEITRLTKTERLPQYSV